MLYAAAIHRVASEKNLDLHAGADKIYELTPYDYRRPSGSLSEHPDSALS